MSSVPRRRGAGGGAAALAAGAAPSAPGGADSGGSTPGCGAGTFVACGPDGGPLSGCVLGAWLSGPGPCSSYGLCGVDAGLVECAATDCAQEGYSIFTPAGEFLQGGYVYSKAVGTFSSLLLAIHKPYSFADGGVLFGSSQLADPVSCSLTELVFPYSYPAERCPPGFAATLEALAADGGLWRREPYDGP